MPAPKVDDVALPGGLFNYLYIPKSVVIYNPKLGIMLTMFRLYVVVFMLYEYMLDLSWTLEHVVPEGFVSYFASPDWAYYDHTVKAEAQQHMCTTAAEFRYEGNDMNIKPTGCMDLLPGDTWIKGDSSMFVPTYLEDVWIEQVNGEESCGKLQLCCSPSPPSHDLGGAYFCDKHGFKDGTFEVLENKNSLGEQLCRCQKQASFFVRGADGLKVTLHPSFVAKLPQKREAGTTAHRADNVLTLVKVPTLSGKDLKRFKDLQANTASFGGEAKVTKDPANASLPVNASLLELEGREADDDARPPEPHTLSAAPRLMRRPRKGSLIDGSDTSGSLTVDNFQEAGMTVVEAMRVGGAAAVAAAREETTQLYEDVTGASSRMVRREDVAEVEVQAAAEHSREEQSQGASSESWSNYLYGLRSSFTGEPAAAPVKDTVIRPGEPVEMSLEAWLEHAMVVEGQPGNQPVPFSVLASTGEDEFLLDANNGGAHVNEIEGSKHRFPSFRVTGVELTVDMKWMNPRAHGLSHNGTVLQIDVLARGGWHTMPQAYHIEPQDPVTGRAKMVLRRFSGVSIRFQSTGQFSHFSFVAVATALSAMIVYIGLPGLIINFIAKSCLGNASNYYWMAANQVLDPKDMFTGMAARALALKKAFPGKVTTKEVEEALMSTFKTSSSLKPEQLEKNMQVLSKMLVAVYGNKEEGVITGDQLADAALSDEPLHMDDAAPMYVHDTSQNNVVSRVMEYLFINNEYGDLNSQDSFQEVEVELEKSSGESLGIDIDFTDDHIAVSSVQKGGAVDRWNQAHPDKAVIVGDIIASVNGKNESVKQMMEACKSQSSLKIKFKRKK